MTLNPLISDAATGDPSAVDALLDRHPRTDKALMALAKDVEQAPPPFGDHEDGERWDGQS